MMLRWNKALSDSWCDRKVFLWFAKIYVAKWKENLEVYQKSPGALIQALLLTLWELKGLLYAFRFHGRIMILAFSLVKHLNIILLSFSLEARSSHKFKIDFSFIIVRFNSSLCWTLFLLYTVSTLVKGRSHLGQLLLGCSFSTLPLSHPKYLFFT